MLDDTDFCFPFKRIYSEKIITNVINKCIKVVHDEKKNKIVFSLLDLSNIRFSEMYETAEFILKLKDSNQIKINGNNALKNDNPFKKKISNGFVEFLNSVLEMGALLLRINIPLEKLTTKEVLDEERVIRNLEKAFVDKTEVVLDFKNNNGLYIQLIGNRQLIVEYEKLENGNFLIFDYLRNKRNIAVYNGNLDSPKEISRWFAIKPENLLNTIFDQQEMIKDLKNGTEDDLVYLNIYILLLLNEYDKGQKELMDVIDKLQKILDCKKLNNEVNQINRLQIEYRKKGKLSDEEKRSCIY